MRLLAAAAHLNEKVCVPLTHKLFGAYWVHNKGKVLVRKHVLESLYSDIYKDPVFALCALQHWKTIETLLSGKLKQ